jgi:ubiquinone/menaquinone biosynthesis C-methylase UbiE
MSKYFARNYDAFMGLLEKKGFSDIRQELLKEAKGNVLEIGSGTGLNVPFYTYPDQVTALEPNPEMRAKSLQRAKIALIPLEIIAGDAENLPFEDDTFDTVVGTLVLCSIPNPEKALREIHRVCKPDGTILFFEHIRLNHRLWGSLQDFLTPVWKKLCDGCHLNRNSLELMEQTGFNVTHVTRHYRNLFITVKADLS